ncbi:hypothetical protein FOZ60_013419 [Perkinsus olseni]|uniref:Uncharacterized protein n=2 Tax=Perkinsus olseni TaxID=32597 RepID=A0A7J6P8G3_PEROL|nr:hypothetical protein FOZ60_013419 [Perkinsus olseni]
MINFAPIWLFAILPLVVNAAPAVGYFRRQTEEYHMYFFVTEDQTAWRFVFNAYRLDVSPETPEVYYNPTGFLEELSLTEVTDNVYSIGYPPEVLDEWYFNIAWMLYRARQVDSRAGSPPGGIQPGDLVTLNQTSGDTYTMNFRGETIEFLRITVALDDLEPGYFEYKGPVAPHLKLSVYVRYDGGSRSLGSVGLYPMPVMGHI